MVMSPEWGCAERYVIAQASQGLVADLSSRNARAGCRTGNGHHVHHGASQTDGRGHFPLDGRFVEDFLLRPEMSCHLTRFGLRIRHAWIRGTLDLQNAELQHTFWLDYSRIDDSADLSNLHSTSYLSFERTYFLRDASFFGARIKGQLMLDQAHVAENLRLDLAHIEGNLFLRHALAPSVSANHSTIDQQMSLNDLTSRYLDLSGMSIGGSMLLRDIRIQRHFRLPRWLRTPAMVIPNESFGMHTYPETGAYSPPTGVDLQETTVQQTVELDGSRIGAPLVADGLRTERRLSLSGGRFKTLSLTEGRIQGDLLAFRIYLSGALELDGTRVGGSALIGGSDAAIPSLIANRVTVAGDLDLIANGIGRVELTRSNVGKRLILRSDPVPAQPHRWSLDLRDTQISSLQIDRAASLPSIIALGGWKLDEWVDPSTDMVHQWLGRATDSGLQPFKMTAEVMRNTAHDDIADIASYDTYEHRRLNSGFWEWLSLSAGKYIANYGIGSGFLLLGAWVVLLTLLGALILRYFGEHRQMIQGPPPTEVEIGFFYSLDMLVPVFQLRKVHYDIDIKSAAVRYYFYCHKIAGYILGAFILSWLGQLTRVGG